MKNQRQQSCWAEALVRLAETRTELLDARVPLIANVHQRALLLALSFALFRRRAAFFFQK